MKYSHPPSRDDNSQEGSQPTCRQQTSVRHLGLPRLHQQTPRTCLYSGGSRWNPTQGSKDGRAGSSGGGGASRLCNMQACPLRLSDISRTKLARGLKSCCVHASEVKVHSVGAIGLKQGIAVVNWMAFHGITNSCLLMSGAPRGEDASRAAQWLRYCFLFLVFPKPISADRR